jgi:hypothetical protein
LKVKRSTLLTVVLLVGYSVGLSLLVVLGPGGSLGVFLIAAAAIALAGVAMAAGRTLDAERRTTSTAASSPAERPAEIRGRDSVAGRQRDTTLFPPLAPVADLLHYWRSLDLSYHPFYGLPLVIIGVLLIAALHWWSVLVIVPLFALVVYVFRFDDVFRVHS